MSRYNVLIVIDCLDLERLLRFWAAALGYRTAGTTGQYGLLLPTEPAHPPVILQRVPEPKTAKTRVHFDIQADDVEGKVRELEALGASRIDIGQAADAGFVVLADPEGNEFCVCPGLGGLPGSTHSDHSDEETPTSGQQGGAPSA
jgi:hypothetical protein